MKKSSIYLVIVVSFFIISCKTKQIVTDTQDAEKSLKQGNYKNIKIIESSAFMTGACEPSIAISPRNQKNIVAGNVLSDYHYSSDGGLTWKSKAMQSKLGVYGDPCIIADFNGDFYYLHLSNPDGRAYNSKSFLNTIVIHRSLDQGKTWNDGIGIGKNEPAQQDKEWATVDPKTGAIYVTWTEFDKYGSKDPKHRSRIRFASSIDKGNSFSKAITISDFEGDALDDDLTTEGAVPAVDLKGNIYVSWAYDNKIYFDKSADKGKTWLPKDVVIIQQIAGWSQDIPGIGRCNGMPVTQVDISKSKYKGNIYINWTDQRNGKDNTDVFIIKSSDHGKNWSKPIKVNNDQTKSHQFFTWMSVDPVTGYIYIVYYDRSRYAHFTKLLRKNQTDVVLATSKNGGKTFTNEIISKSPFVPDPYIFFGDYNNISAYDGIIRPIWTRYEDAKLSIWTAIINTN
jgi:hypothetical protein